jgi:protein TonB
VAVASGLDGLDTIWSRRRPRGPGAVIGTAVAIAIHVGVAAALVSVDVSALLRGDTTVELEMKEPPPPPPEIKPEPPPPPPPPEVKHVVVRHAPAPTPPPEAPPPSETPPKAGDPPPVFGVSLDSTVGGDGPGMAVPVGNTLMTKPKKAEAPAAVPSGSSDADRLPAPVPEIFIAEQASVTYQPSVPFPAEMQRMGIEGVVKLKILIDDSGNVRRVTVVEKAGHGFDELAREALKKFKFSPARTSDGKAVPTNIVYTYRFELPQ